MDEFFQCTKCGRLLSRSEFFSDKRIRKGIKSQCKRCCYERMSAYQKTERGKAAFAKSTRKYVQTERGRETSREGYRRYHATEKGKQKSREYERSARVRSVRKDYKRSESGKLAISNYNHRRRANLQKTKYKISDQEFQELLHKCVGKCSYCGRSNVKLELDHIVPLSRGGLHEINNLALVCGSCNRSKGSKLLSEWKGGKYASLR